MSRPKMTKRDQVFWLQQHVMTRMFAVMASRERLRELQNSYPKDSVWRYDLEHIFHATWEGQHAALRWLIEFAGVMTQPNSNIVTIEHFDAGARITASHKHYRDIKEAWILCSEITSHPTMRKRMADDLDMNPIRLPEEQLHNVARILRAHFGKVYEAAGIPLIAASDIQ